MARQIANMPPRQNERQYTLDLLCHRHAAPALEWLTAFEKPVRVAHLVGLQQPLKRNFRLAEQLMAFAAVQALPLLEQRLVVKGRLVAREVADGIVQPLLQQQPFQLRWWRTDQFQLYRFFTRAKCRNGCRQLQAHRLVLILRHADAHGPQQPPGNPIGLLAKLLDVQQQPACRLQQQRTFLRQVKAAFAPAAQAITQAGFQLCHALADGGLAQAQHALCGAEAAGLDYSDEQPQQVQVGVVHLSEHYIAPFECQLYKLAIPAM